MIRKRQFLTICSVICAALLCINLYSNRDVLLGSSYTKELSISSPGGLPLSDSRPAATSSLDPNLLRVITSHPRLFASSQNWQDLRQSIEDDSYLRSWNERIFEKAYALYDEEPINVANELRASTSGLLDVAREVQLRVKHWAYAYKLTHQPRWKFRIWQELQAAVGNSTLQANSRNDFWNPKHWLDVAEFIVAFSFAFDWLYDAWTPDERKAIMWSIIELGLRNGLHAFESNEWFLSVTGNWNCVVNAGMIIGSLAIYHEDPTFVSKELLVLSIENARRFCGQALYEDGTWSETPDYWYFGTQSHAQLHSALLTASRGLADIMESSEPWKKTGFFHIYSLGAVEKFNYGDCGPRKITATGNSLFFYGKMFNVPAYTLYQRDRYDAPDPLSMFWYDRHVNGSWHLDLPLDKAFLDPKGSWVSMRSSWSDSEALFVAMKASELKGHQTHGHLDAGDFVIDAMGERWAMQLCHEDYDSPNYFSHEEQDSKRWDYYRCGTRGQNTLLYGQSNQVVTARPTSMFMTGHGNGESFWISDLTSAYPNSLSTRRGLKMVNKRSSILIQDEIVSAQVKGQWRMHTAAKVDISEDGKKARLETNHRALQVILQSPATAVFKTEIVTLKPNFSPQHNRFDKSDSLIVAVLLVDIPPGNQTVAIIFSPEAGTSIQSPTYPQLEPLDKWMLSDESSSI